ncbi:iron chelate uptake ABC transporter family permease subunit [Lipingzhangella sp. LS1_29]|uniref:Iron chelate uptake ABC transporter family permease subunit n=1 Tax=Lipingzhangella rawalii TaxID=2055835 RepID=A0ABU2H1D0_9ACTN|nr:iron chelate uptake ABC transporter family permease subunit [Lipingzhangella rawalii]MDS1269113.1 iron chelate uptake ABC transporter family permease subunit [Lipingzhangella rawalii]
MPRRLIRLATLVAALGVLGLCVLLSIAVGANAITPATVGAALVHNDGSYEHTVIHELRIPRTVLGVCVGAALGLAGALMQALTRNPLAEPGILGVNSGAAAAVVLGIFVFGITSPDDYVWLAFVGAGIAAAVVYILGTRGSGQASPVRLALAGTAVAAVLQGLIHGVIVLNDFVFDRVRFWQVGSLTGRDVDMLVLVGPFLAVGLVLGLLLGPSLNAMALGQDVATALGARTARTRMVTALAIVLLCGAATAVAGPIWFVGLVVPHMARALVGIDQRWILPTSALLAAILLTGADTLGRIVLPQGELEVGIITALVGAPVFIAMVRRKELAAL